jgi:hypothetical protein
VLLLEFCALDLEFFPVLGLEVVRTIDATANIASETVANTFLENRLERIRHGYGIVKS